MKILKGGWRAKKIDGVWELRRPTGKSYFPEEIMIVTTSSASRRRHRQVAANRILKAFQEFRSTSILGQLMDDK